MNTQWFSNAGSILLPFQFYVYCKDTYLVYFGPYMLVTVRV